MPVTAATRSGDHVGGHLAHPVHAVEVRFDGAEVDQVLREQRVHDREQQRRVGAGCDRQPLVGAVGGAGAHRVDDDDLAPLANSVDVAHHVGRSEQRSLRRGGVGAHDDQQVGALDVGDRELHHPPYIRCDDRFFGHWSTVPGE